jgi:hypothetical protein
MKASVIVWVSLTLTFLVGTVSAHAGTLQLTPKIVAAFAADGTYTPVVPMPNPFTWVGSPLIYQVDVFVQIHGLVPPESRLGALGFDVAFLGGATDTGLGWMPHQLLIDINGAEPGGLHPQFPINADVHIPNDLRGISVVAALGVLPPLDPRRSVGIAAPAIIGSFFFEWDGVSYGNVVLEDIAFSLCNDCNGDARARSSQSRLTLMREGCSRRFPERLNQGLWVGREGERFRSVRATQAAKSSPCSVDWPSAMV